MFSKQNLHIALLAILLSIQGCTHHYSRDTRSKLSGIEYQHLYGKTGMMTVPFALENVRFRETSQFYDFETNELVTINAGKIGRIEYVHQNVTGHYSVDECLDGKMIDKTDTYYGLNNYKQKKKSAQRYIESRVKYSNWSKSETEEYITKECSNFAKCIPSHFLISLSQKQFPEMIIVPLDAFFDNKIEAINANVGFAAKLYSPKGQLQKKEQDRQALIIHNKELEKKRKIALIERQKRNKIAQEKRRKAKKDKRNRHINISKKSNVLTKEIIQDVNDNKPEADKFKTDKENYDLYVKYFTNKGLFKATITLNNEGTTSGISYDPEEEKWLVYSNLVLKTKNTYHDPYVGSNAFGVTRVVDKSQKTSWEIKLELSRIQQSRSKAKNLKSLTFYGKLKTARIQGGHISATISSPSEHSYSKRTVTLRNTLVQLVYKDGSSEFRELEIPQERYESVRHHIILRDMKGSKDYRY